MHVDTSSAGEEKHIDTRKRGKEASVNCMWVYADEWARKIRYIGRSKRRTYVCVYGGILHLRKTLDESKRKTKQQRGSKLEDSWYIPASGLRKSN